jgi:hypothetical protein
LLSKTVGFITSDYENDDVFLCDTVQMVPVFQGFLHCHYEVYPVAVIVYFFKCRIGTKFTCTVASGGVILPSSCDGQLWTTYGAIMIRQKN